MTVSEDAIKYVKKNKKRLINEICDSKIYLPSKNPFTLFMAGSPGAGKTEYSRALIEVLEDSKEVQKVIRLDTDELRSSIPQYIGSNSDDVQRAATILFDKIFDQIHIKKINAIIDTTFASPRSLDNVKRAINRGRKVGILYLYQDPIIAWTYTKKREKLEGRSVPKDVFIESYFNAKENVNSIKDEFGDSIELHLFEKNEKNDFNKKASFNIKSLDEFIKEKHTRSSLEKLLPNEV